MASEGPPTAVFNFDILIVWIIGDFEPDMVTDRQPPLSHFHTTFDAVPVDVLQFNWIDLHGFQLDYAVPITGPPAVVTLAYSPFDPGLFTVFGQFYNAWQPILVPKI